MQLELAIFKDLLPLGDVEPLVPAPTPADSPDADPTPSSGNFDVAQQSNFGVSLWPLFSRRVETGKVREF